MNITTRLCLCLAAALSPHQPLTNAQDLETQILLPHPVITSTSFRGYAYGKALLVDPLPATDRGPQFQSLFFGTLASPNLAPSTIYRIDPDPNATPAFSEFSVTPLDARFRFVQNLAYNALEKTLYAVGDVQVQNTRPKGTSLAWLVRQSPYVESGAATIWADSEPPFVLAAGQESRAQGIAIDPAGTVYVSGRAKEAKGYSHIMIRRKAARSSIWEKVYDIANTTVVVTETAICYFPGSATAPAAYLMVGNANNKWTILRSTSGNVGTWFAVDGIWSGNSSAGAKGITYDENTGNLYVVGYRGTFVDPTGWIVRVSVDGGQSWNPLLDVNCPTGSYADAVAAHAGGVTVVGQFSVLRPDGSSSRQVHMVRCMNPGDPLSWTTAFPGLPLPFDETNCSYSMAQAITTDRSGAIFAAGTAEGWLDSLSSPATQYPGGNATLLRLTTGAP